MRSVIFMLAWYYVLRHTVYMSTITKQLKDAGLTKEQIEYAKILLRMGRTIERAIEEAKAGA